MIRWFRNWRNRRRQKMCDRIARLWAECEAELLAEIGDLTAATGTLSLDTTYEGETE